MKVLLAEDNYQMLEFMYDCVPWKKKGLQVSGKCETGTEAWTAAKKDVPDIVITDISMPGMSGLELIEKIKELNPELESLVITCHDDFEYARQALRLYVCDYILKEKLEPDMLGEVLDRTLLRVTNKKAQKQNMHQWKSIAEQSKSSMKKEWIRGLLTHSLEAPPSSGMEFIEMDFSGLTHIPVTARVINTEEEGRLPAVEKISHETVEKTMEAESFICSLQDMYWLFPVSSSLSSGRQLEDMTAALKKMQRQLWQRNEMEICFVIGVTISGVKEMKRGLRSLAALKHEWFYMDKPGIYRLEDRLMDFQEEDIFCHYAPALDELKQLIVTESSSHVKTWVRTWTKILRDEQHHPDRIKSWAHKILTEVELKYHSLQHYSHKSSSVLYSEIHSLKNFSQLHDYLDSYIQKKIETAGRLQARMDRKEVREAKKYVEIHMDKRITMEEVAQHLHLNPSHFSRMFKQENGDTFIEYVTKKKMEQAQHYLLHTDRTVDDISFSLGYDNTSYFNKLFKKYNQMAPSQFRNIR
ncbi:response regulator transcription factor [Salibacterium aidingense]|uniref:response regulator transcription factor n=1 Tax=Salibacterium aidingense TaxID=384933 RepID=UPI003BD38799